MPGRGAGGSLTSFLGAAGAGAGASEAGAGGGGGDGETLGASPFLEEDLVDFAEEEDFFETAVAAAAAATGTGAAW